MPPTVFHGGCYCTAVRYTLSLADPDADARTSLCHCTNCKKFTGGPFGVTTKVDKKGFEVVQGADHVRKHVADNGSGTVLTREFCGTCGGPVMEYGVSTLHFFP